MHTQVVIFASILMAVTSHPIALEEHSNDDVEKRSIAVDLNDVTSMKLSLANDEIAGW